MKISIIIPAYNAANFISQAVESALEQQETAEVILIEDGSTDNSLKVCQALAEKYDEVRLLHHPDRKNHGAGASRNLGMRSSKFDYIAFLDADDYYLSGRFEEARKIFKQYLDCDGVYEAIGKYYENKESLERWEESNMSTSELTTIHKNIPPEELFKSLMLAKFGYFSLNGLTIKRSLLLKTGLMNEKLRLHQDSDFIFKLAYAGNLRPGRLDHPVAIRRIHQNNRISKFKLPRETYKNRIEMWKSSYRWFKKHAGRYQVRLIISRLLSYGMRMRHFNVVKNRFINSELNKRFRLMLLVFEIPEIIFETQYWMKFLPLRIQKMINGS